MAVPAAETLIRMEDTAGVRAHRSRSRATNCGGTTTTSTRMWASSACSIAPPMPRAASVWGVDPTTVENYLLEVDNQVVVPVNTKAASACPGRPRVHVWWVPHSRSRKTRCPGTVK